ncbi:hypothetical protein TWF481_009094 [Arthrobotrys musiformis]|uniref:Uncharacterized protein n=1 Tax=Arthrobotrys musiformis TaxID=47236 RepID=A0AAV9W5B4_9PEZI
MNRKSGPFTGFDLHRLSFVNALSSEHEAKPLEPQKEVPRWNSSLTYCNIGINTHQPVPTEQRTETIKKLPEPKNIADLEHFLGAIGWHRSLIPFYAQRSAPLQRLKSSLVTKARGIFILFKEVNQLLLNHGGARRKQKQQNTSRRSRRDLESKSSFILHDVRLFLGDDSFLNPIANEIESGNQFIGAFAIRAKGGRRITTDIDLEVMSHIDWNNLSSRLEGAGFKVSAAKITGGGLNAVDKSSGVEVTVRSPNVVKEEADRSYKANGWYVVRDDIQLIQKLTCVVKRQTTPRHHKKANGCPGYYVPPRAGDIRSGNSAKRWKRRTHRIVLIRRDGALDSIGPLDP